MTKRNIRKLTRHWGRRSTFDYGTDALLRAQRKAQAWSQAVESDLLDATLGPDNFDHPFTGIAARRMIELRDWLNDELAAIGRDA